MKINEKCLSKFAGSGIPPEKDGYLHKRGDFNKGFQKRWFVLKGNLLFYYERRHDRDPLGVIVLEGCTIELSDNEEKFTFMINFLGSGSRTYVMSSDTQEDMEAWMKVLSAASYDFMKLCVGELKKQLKELDSDSDKMFMQGALADRTSLMKSELASHSTLTKEDCLASNKNALPSNQFVSMKRQNPFDSVNSDEHQDLRDNDVEDKPARTFLQMHEELRIQIEEITEWCNTKHQSVDVKN